MMGRRRGALAVWVDAERGPDDGMRVLLAHEALHEVFGGALRVDAGGRDAAWFSEGFAVHYARRMLFEEGMISAESFLADVGRARGREGGATDGGALPELPDDAFGPCFRRKAEMRVTASLGFDPASLSGVPQIIRGTVAGSNAEKAGVRDGALVLKSNVRAGQALDPEATVELVLAGRGGKHVARFKPATKERVVGFVAQACKRAER
ncbi:MAG: hypothetical protein R3B70_40905 [Polyangiaceae bacterium]